MSQIETQPAIVIDELVEETPRSLDENAPQSEVVAVTPEDQQEELSPAALAQDQLIQSLTEFENRLELTEQQLSELYHQRNRLAIGLAIFVNMSNGCAGWIEDTSKVDWEPEWRTVVAIDFIGQQICFSMTPEEAEHAKSVLPEYPNTLKGENLGVGDFLGQVAESSPSIWANLKVVQESKMGSSTI